MASPKGMEPETPSAKSFAPLLVQEGRPPRKRLSVSFQLSKLQQRMWDKRQWKKAATAAVRDVRAIHWVATLTSTLALGWIAALVYLLYYIGIASNGWGSGACQPDGSFDVFQNDYNLWSVSGFFQITLAWGRFSFADAKAIDVAWDVVFGRGGQALLASISWGVFADYTTISMQARPVTYQTFQTIFLQDQPGVYSTFYLARDFVRSRGLQSRAMMVIMVFVAVFVLLFPTLGSAMTGYSANNDAYIKGYDGTLIPFSDFKVAGYVIHDAQRINMTGEVVLTYPYAIRDVQKYGFYGLEDKESVWMGQSLPAPVLNISASWLLPSAALYGWNWTDPRTGRQPFIDGSRVAYAAGNKTYPLSYLKANGSCQPMSDPGLGADSVRESYEWGFSYLQLYMLIGLLMAWTLCLVYMWTKARLTMRMRRRYDVPKDYKGVLELSDAIRKQLQESGPDDLSHDQLRDEIKKRLGGGRIELERADAPETYGLWRGARVYCKDEKWWLVAMLGMLGPCAGLASIDNSFGWWLLVPILSTTLAMLVGRSIESRCVLFLVGASLGTITFLGAWYGHGGTNPSGYY
ncbi:hypothetical protein LX32DRAFT_675167 [Colletotrichum zoysiae]|uniref:Uncharacterized protein n=1 Tax=Colletotrichum zoysiae TaxID=1216348 RepID=A0AAD9HD50_9PEZI|nr:hypothetical protein LX32DRAFT_675167 [Colletotrichum zoysiae]